MENEREIVIREALPADVSIIFAMIRELATYEKLAHEVTATQEELAYWVFKQRKARVLLAQYRGEVIGFALFFSNFSTFLGKPGIYLEDLYVRPGARGKGAGKALLKQLAKITDKEGYGRLEWACLDWNKPSVQFYLALGAQPMNGWTTFRVAGGTLQKLAE